MKQLKKLGPCKTCLVKNMCDKHQVYQCKKVYNEDSLIFTSVIAKWILIHKKCPDCLNSIKSIHIECHNYLKMPIQIFFLCSDCKNIFRLTFYQSYNSTKPTLFLTRNPDYMIDFEKDTEEFTINEFKKLILKLCHHITKSKMSSIPEWETELVKGSILLSLLEKRNDFIDEKFDYFNCPK